MAKLSTVGCAFCKGKGKDPFEIMSRQSICQVCGGRGRVTVLQPHVVCAYCGATGVAPGTRNVCTSCHGRGVVSIAADGKLVCPECKGNGRAKQSNLSCSKCGGKGVV